MMKKNLMLAGLFGCLFLFWGCPYTSMVPLSKPSEKLRPELIGTWIPEADLASEKPSYYTIAKFDSLHYDIEHYQYKEENEEYSVKNYVAHTTYIDGFLFMNMNESGTEKFLMHRIEFVPDGFKLYEVTDNIDETFETSEQMYKFFKQHMKLSFFYNKDEVMLVRKTK